MMETKADLKLIEFRMLTTDDIEPLRDYLHHLSQETKNRFGPHEFDRATLDRLFVFSDQYIAAIGVLKESARVISYALVKKGYLEHDESRLQGYGLSLSNNTDCTYAPSVADDWQGKGMGQEMYYFILPLLKNLGFKRIILWGGVQSDNSRAVAYYKKLGFESLGQFEFHGLNTDMICQIQ